MVKLPLLVPFATNLAQPKSGTSLFQFVEYKNQNSLPLTGSYKCGTNTSESTNQETELCVSRRRDSVVHFYPNRPYLR
jgi:hypothetical protein